MSNLIENEIPIPDETRKAIMEYLNIHGAIPYYKLMEFIFGTISENE